MAVTRQQLEQQLVAAHRTKNVQAAQQAAYAIRAYDQNVLSAQVPSINAPPPIERVPKPTFGSWLGNVTTGIGEGLGEQVQGIGGAIQRGVTAFAQDPLKASAAAFMTALEPARQGFTQPVQAYKDVGTGIVETGKQMYQQATSGPIGLGTVIGQNIDIMPGPDLPGGKRRPTMAELDVYHGTPHTFDPETGAPLGRFRSEKIGTGEGAQAYGYGLYFAESPGTAKTYQINLSSGNDPRDWIHEVATILGKDKKFGQQDIVNELRRYEQTSALADNPKIISLTKRMAEGYEWSKNGGETWTNDALRAIKQLDADLPKPPTGRFYKVDLPDAKIEQMLDWDRPLSQQSDYVLERLGFHNKPRDFEAEARAVSGTPEYARLEELMNTQVGGARVPDMTGEDFYRMRGGKDRDKSEYFRSLGIPGIKYLDAGSRSGEKGTRNFVVFPGEEQNLTILERDGVKAEVPKAGGPKFDLSADSAKGIRETKVGNTQISYEYDGNMASIASIRTPSGKRNQGSARAAMEQFLAETDALGIPVKLESSPLDKRTTDARLFKFYKSLGFEPTGRKINAAGDPEMIRQPRAN